MPVKLVVPRSRLVWIVAGAACLEAISEAIAAGAERRIAAMWVWYASAAVIFLAGVLVENLKAAEGEA